MLVIDSLQTFGLFLLVMRILPQLDMVRAIFILGAVGLLPVTCKLSFSTRPNYSIIGLICWYTWHILAFIVQIGTPIAVVLGQFDFGADISFNMTIHRDHTQTVERGNETQQITDANIVYRRQVENDGFMVWEVPTALILASILWWENFVDIDVKIGKTRIPLRFWKASLHDLRQKTVLFSSIWKTGLVIILAYTIIPRFRLELGITRSMNMEQFNILLDYAPAAVNISSGVLGFYFAALACRLCMQRFSFALPLLLTTPLSVMFILLQCHYNFMPRNRYLWMCPEAIGPPAGAHPDSVLTTWTYVHIGLCLAIWLSQIVIGVHIWNPEQERLASLET